MKNKYKIGLWINAILTVAVCAACILSIVEGKYIAGCVVDIVVIGLIAYYSFAGYKKPHGNLLKQIMLLFGASLSIYCLTAAKYENNSTVLMLPITMMIIAYIAGRLDRIKENAILMVIVLINFGHCCVGSVIKSGGNLGFATNHIMIYPLFIWIVLCGAYFTRYSAHKEAGLETK